MKRGAKTDLLAASDSVVLGNMESVSSVQDSQVNSQESSETASRQTSEASLSESLSLSQSVSASELASKSTSLSLSASLSVSLSASLASKSESVSQTDSSAHSQSESTLGKTSEQSASASVQSVSKSDSSSDSKVGMTLVSSESTLLNASLTSEVQTNRQLSETATGLLAASVVADAERLEQEKRLKDLALDIYTYKAQAVDLPNTDAAILKEIKPWMPFVSVWLIVTVMWHLRLFRLVRLEIVLPMRCSVRHLVNVILVMVLVLMPIATSVHPSII